MKFSCVLFAAAVCMLSSCSNEPVPHFSLVINTNHGDTLLTYTLTDTSITITETAPNYSGDWHNDFHSVMLNEEAALVKISKLQAKSYDCDEQHALMAHSVTFSNDSGTVNIDPNVNHPKEIDEAVRIFNEYVPGYRRLEFIDMQPAIEPDGKLRL